VARATRPGPVRSDSGRARRAAAGRSQAPEHSEPREGERLQKVLAAAGVASRRAAEELIVAGRVTVNGRVVTTLGSRMVPAQDRLEVDGKRVATDPEKEYVLLNKPPGVISTARDDRGRTTVVDLVASRRRLFPVGRLDADAQGLMILTNDGALAHRLAHPRFGIERAYRVEVEGAVAASELDRLRKGIRLEDGIARAVRARVVAKGKGRTQLEVVLAEGRNHEVKRLLAAVGHPVVRLVRRTFGPIGLGDLKPGSWRRLSPAEVGALQQLVDL